MDNPEAEKSPEGTDASTIQAVLDLAAKLDEFWRKSATPGDVLTNENFVAGVEQLRRDLEVADLLAYVSGDNPIISAMALDALNTDAYPQELTPKLLALVGELGPWPMYFLLRTLAMRSKEPLVGAVLSKAQPDWPSQRLVMTIVSEFIGVRAEAGEQPTFGAALETLDEAGVQSVAELLQALGSEYLAPLVAEYQGWHLTRVDQKLLASMGSLWTRGTDLGMPLRGMEAEVVRLENLIDSERPRSALLIGESGVGKTEILRALAHRLEEKGWTIFIANASQLLAGQSYIGQLEERIQQLIPNIQSAKKVLWVIPEFHSLMFAGMHQHSQTGILDMVLPYIENGIITVVGETRPAVYEQVLQERDRVRTALEPIRIEAMSDPETLELAREWSALRSKLTGGVIVDDETLVEAQQLAKQYVTYMSSPGNVMQLLTLTERRLAQEAGDASTVAPIAIVDLLKTLSQLTGLPDAILDDRVSLNLVALKNYFDERVIGQPEAVETIVERVAMIKAGLTDPSRPSAVFLFVGPTGTGKTQIAKTLAEYLFGSDERMIRLDMSEFQTPESLFRVLGDPSDNNPNSMALVNQIRKQPFSVILMDEIEKAHPNVWDLFLQLFDDARLTDFNGNTADFSHSIIILTSNLGAGVPLSQGIGFTAGETVSAQRRIEEMVAQTFRKEFVNRLDRIVIFRALSRSSMRNILVNDLKAVLDRRGLRNREWAVEFEDSAIDFLLDQGFTKDLGARPLKRAIEQHLLAPLAMTIVSHQIPEGDQFLFVRSDGTKLDVSFIDPDGDDSAPEPQIATIGEGEEALTIGSLILEPRGTVPEVDLLRNRLGDLEESIDDEEWDRDKSGHLEEMSASGFWESDQRFAVLGKVEFMDRIEAGLTSAKSLMNRLEGNEPGNRTSYSPDLVKRVAQQIYLLDNAVEALETGGPRDAFVRIDASIDSAAPTAKTDEFASRISRMYKEWAKRRRMRISVVDPPDSEGQSVFSETLAISGFGAHRILQAEQGLHVLELPKDAKTFHRLKVRVRVAPQPIGEDPSSSQLEDQASLLFKDEAKKLTIVRRYREEPTPLVRDSVKKWRTGRVNRVLDGDFDIIQ